MYNWLKILHWSVGVRPAYSLPYKIFPYFSYDLIENSSPILRPDPWINTLQFISVP